MDPKLRFALRSSIFDLRHSPQSRPWGWRLCFALAMTGITALTGCAGPLKPIFEPSNPPIAWPAAPKPPRIRYLGSLNSSADLKAPRSAWGALGELFVGSTPPEPVYGPRSVVCTRDGQRAWIADPGGRCLHLFDLEHRVYKKILTAGATSLLGPVGVCLGPEDSIYLCDSERGAIHRLSSRDGRWLESLRLPDEILRPVAVFFDEAARELYVVDGIGHNLKVLDAAGQLLRTLGRRGTGPGEFNFPSAVTGGSGALWVADTGNHRVQSVTATGEPIASFGQVGDAPGDLALPKGVAVDGDGHVYVVDGRFENVQVFDSSGRLLLFFGEEGAGPGEFWLPGGIFIEPGGRIWVCDSYNRRVQVFEYLREHTENGAPK